MQSYSNRFGGDVVLDSFNMAYRDDSNLDQIFRKQIFLDFYYEDLKSKSDCRNTALFNKELIIFGFTATCSFA